MAVMEAESKLWNLADLFRKAGQSGGAEQIARMLIPLVYLRWLDTQEAEREAMALFEGQTYAPLVPSGFRWREWCVLRAPELKAFVSGKLLAAVNELPLGQLAGALSDGVHALTELREEELSLLVDWVSAQSFESPKDQLSVRDRLDQMLDASSGHYQGESRTPSAVLDVMIELANPQLGWKIYDPCTGTAALLTGALDRVREENKNKSLACADLLELYGRDIQRGTALIAATRLALSGVDEIHLSFGDSLEHPKPDSPCKEGYDLILAHPPWGMRVDTRIAEAYPFPTPDATALFVQHILAHLRPDGRAVILVPQSFLFSKGQIARIRETLLKENQLEAVLELPEGALGASIRLKTSILLIRKGLKTRSFITGRLHALFNKGGIRKPMVLKPEWRSLLNAGITGSKASQDFLNRMVDTTGGVVDEQSLDWTLSAGVDYLESYASLDGVEKVDLSAIAKIEKGRSPKKEFLHEIEGVDPGWLSVLTTTHLDNGTNKGGCKGVRESDLVNIPSVARLAPGDVLLSEMMTHRVQLVRNGLVGQIAGQGLYVLRPDKNRVEPRYLAAYLLSNTAQSLLDSMCVGSTIRRYSKTNLSELPVLLPPLSVQQKLLNLAGEGDILETLKDYLTRDDVGQLMDWLERAVEVLESRPEHERNHTEVLMDGTINFSALRSLALPVAERLEDSALEMWVDVLQESVYEHMMLYEGVGGLERLSSLLLAQQALSRIPSVKEPQSCVRLIERFTDLVHQYLEGEIRALQDKTDLDFEVLEAFRDADGLRVTIKMTNAGEFPLRSIQVRSEDAYQVKVAMLRPGEERVLSFSRGADHVEEPEMRLYWSANTFLGAKIEGHKNLLVAVLLGSPNVSDAEIDLGSSPYITGDPVRPKFDHVFFGRQELLGRIRRLVETHGNVVLLEGNRRAGKTSILHHLEGTSAIPGWLCVYSSLQDAEGSKDALGVPTESVFRLLTKVIILSVHQLKLDVPLPDGNILAAGGRNPMAVLKACKNGISRETPFTDFEAWLSQILDLLSGRNLRLLVMLDEYDKLQEGIDNGVTSPQVPENIRALIQNREEFSAILTGSKRLKRLREEYWSALYGLGTTVSVSFLDQAASRDLIQRPVEGRLRYAKEAVERIYQLTAGQPYLIQCLCNTIFDQAYVSNQTGVGLRDIEQAAKILIESNEHFSSLWDYVRTNRRRLLLMLIQECADNQEPARLGVLRERFSGYRLDVEDRALSEDLTELMELELVSRKGDSHNAVYELTIPLMGMWMEAQKDFDDVLNLTREELSDEH